MADNTTRTALVTGANSGLGFEAAAQFAEAGYAKVTIAARSLDKAATAKDALVARTGRDVFETVALDNGELDTVEAAASELADRGVQIDALILNAGMVPGNDVTRTADGIEATIASTLIGHHVLTMRLLERGVLSDRARIVIAGSEAARGDVPTMNPLDVPAFAGKHFNGDLEAAITAQIRMEPPARHKAGNTYATAKLFVAWWAADLARRLPAGMTVNAVSPGSAPDTNASRNAPFYMRYLMLPIMKLMPARMGMAGSVEDAAHRYLVAAEFDADVTGEFYASKPGKMTGEMVPVDLDEINDRTGQEALWNVTTRIAGGVGYPARN